MEIKQAIKQKLKSNNGATLMIALFVFLILATIGSIILAFASASSGSIEALIKQDQCNREVLDAMKFVTTYLQEDTCNVSFHYEGHAQARSVGSGYESTDAQKEAKHNFFQVYVVQSVLDAKFKGTEETDSFTLQAPNSTSNVDIEMSFKSKQVKQEEDCLEPVDVRIVVQSEQAKAIGHMTGIVSRTYQKNETDEVSFTPLYTVSFVDAMIEVGDQHGN